MGLASPHSLVPSSSCGSSSLCHSEPLKESAEAFGSQVSSEPALESPGGEEVQDHKQYFHPRGGSSLPTQHFVLQRHDPGSFEMLPVKSSWRSNIKIVQETLPITSSTFIYYSIEV